MPAQNLSTWFAGNTQRSRGEFALVLHAQPKLRSEGFDNDRLLKILMQELPLKTAVKVAAEISGAPKNALYVRALELKQASADL
jgi:16S rRNA (cytidine1402-2'-O)-methyltransferase